MPFPEEEDLRLQREVATLDSKISDFDKWMIAFGPDRADSQHALPKGLVTQVLEMRRKVRNYRTAVDVPVALAIYGASQCGKSLLVGRLTQSTQEGVTALGLGCPDDPTPDNLSFVEDINPALGVEATAVVSRFTPSDRAGIPPDCTAYPVRARLFSHADILKAFGRGFLTECNGEIEWTAQSVKELMERELVPSFRGAEVDVEWRADIIEATRYLKEAMRHHLLKIDHIQLGQLMASMPLTNEGYVKLACSLFWENWAGLSALFEKLYRLRRETFRNVGSILMAWQAVHFILDSSRAPSYQSKALGGEVEWSQVRLCEQGDQHVLKYGTTEGLQVPLDLLQGITSELQVPLIPERLNDIGGALFEKADCIDIPGARASAGTAGGATAESVERDKEFGPLHILKRGKVGLMFDKYAEELQANVILYLQAMEQLESRGELAPQIERWGRTRFTPEWPNDLPEEEVATPSLFIGLTKVDKEVLGLNAHPDVFESKVNQELAQHFSGWINDYGHKGNVFKNLYLLRYPGIIDREDAHQVFDLGGWREAFLACPAVVKYVKSPEEKWEAAFEPGNDGVRSLMSAILGKVDNSERRATLKSRIGSLDSTLEGVMSGLYVDPSLQAQIDARTEVATKVVDWLRGDTRGYRTRALVDELHCDGSIAEAVLKAALDHDTSPIAHVNFRRVAEQILRDWQLSRDWQRVCVADHGVTGAGPTIDAQTLNRLGNYLVDYINERCIDDIEKALDRAQQIPHPDIKEEAFRRYAEIVVDTLLLTPGPRPELSTPGVVDFDVLCHEKLRERWEQILPKRLAEAVSEEMNIVPAGNGELGVLLGATATA